MVANTSPPDTRSAYRMLIAGTLIVVCAMGIRATFGLFMQPLGIANGWGRDVFSMAFAIQNLVWGLFGIVMGTVADRWGAGRAIAISVVAYALGLIGLRFATTEMELYLTAGLMIGIGQAGTTFAVILPVVARSFPPASRSTAMGIASAGGSLGQFLIVPSGQFLIGAMDWTGALWALSLLIAVGLPLAWNLRGKPSADMGGRELSLGAAVQGAISDRSYQFLFASYAVCGFHTAFVTLHLPAYVMDKGLTAANGAFALALVGLFNTFGSFWAGKLGGKHSKKMLLAWVYWARAIGILFLMSVPLTPLTLYIFAAWMGVFWLGTVPLTQGLIGDIFGLRYAATLSGVVFLGHQIGSFLGVWLGGRLYVTTGSYDVVWWMSVALALIAGALCLPVKEGPRGQPAVTAAPT